MGDTMVVALQIRTGIYTAINLILRVLRSGYQVYSSSSCVRVLTVCLPIVLIDTVHRQLRIVLVDA